MRRWSMVLLALAAAFGVRGAAVPHHVDASLVAGDATAAGASAIWVGLKLRHDAGWHTYWKNPGDAGMPTKISWTLPEGWTAGGINWPAPERMQVGPLASYGYEGEVVLPLKVFPPAGWNAKQTVHLAAHVNWLVCKE